jgi:hypothetical protein
METVVFGLILLVAYQSRSNATASSAETRTASRQAKTGAQKATGPTLEDYGSACKKGAVAGGIVGTAVPGLGTTVGGAVGCIGGVLVTAVKELPSMSEEEVRAAIAESGCKGPRRICVNFI